MKSIVSPKGQITLPAEVRERLGLAPGTAVHFQIRQGSVVVRKGKPGEHPVDRVFGRLKLRRSVDALIDEMRGPGPRGLGRHRRQLDR